MSRFIPEREASGNIAYGGGRLDRLSEKRDDPALIAHVRGHTGARHIVFCGDRIVLPRADAANPLHGRGDLGRIGGNSSTALLLGLDRDDNDVPWFATLSDRAPESFDADPDFLLNDLRSLALEGAMSPAALGAVAQGAAIVNWHRTHGFCARCGTKSVVAAAGWRRECPNCGAQHFPRTDPVVIMLVVDGERCLMGRQPRFAPGSYSCLAGFVEPGETIEDAVRREIREESGIIAGRVGYHSSQPWPFPMSLMFGMHAEALSTEIVMDTAELEDCRWFGRDEARSMLEGTHPHGLVAPKPLAIAHHLLKAWVYEA